MRPLFLISNDGGYQAKGINCLVEYLRDMGDIIVCTPTGPRSGFITPLTLNMTAWDYINKKKMKIQI